MKQGKARDWLTGDHLGDILHFDTVYPAGSNVLEAGCGVGAQTIILARNSPNAKFTAIDVSKESLRAAKRACLFERLHERFVSSKRYLPHAMTTTASTICSYASSWNIFRNR